MKVGFVGVGTMGRFMALNLIKAGHELYVHDVAQVPADVLAAGARNVASNAEAARQGEIVIAMLPDTPDVEAALFATDGIADGLSPGKVFVDMSSISPTATKRFAERVNALGCAYLDAPVSGGVGGAEQATLSIMIGGPAAALDRARPLFEAMGKTITHLGEENGAGQTCKVANQIVVGCTVAIVAEALVFAAKAGADPVKVREALLGGAAGSMILRNHGQRMIDRNFAPQFRAELQHKDLSLAVQASRELGMVLPNATATWSLFNALAARGEAKEDHAAVVKVLEALANHRLDGEPAG